MADYFPSSYVTLEFGARLILTSAETARCAVVKVTF